MRKKGEDNILKALTACIELHMRAPTGEVSDLFLLQQAQTPSVAIGPRWWGTTVGTSQGMERKIKRLVHSTCKQKCVEKCFALFLFCFVLYGQKAGIAEAYYHFAVYQRVIFLSIY